MQRFVDLDSNEQKKIFRLVKKLKSQGLGYKRIIKRIGAEQKVKLHLSTLSYWFNNDVKLLGGENWFEEKPSRELSYLIGVMFGDGSITHNSKKQEYIIKLEAIDKDFVKKFSHCVSAVLDRERDYPIHKNKRGPIYSTHARSKQLYYFIKCLKKDFSKAKPFIEVYPAEFIQGLADSEGCPCISASKKLSCRIGVAYSTNLPLLEYVKMLLKREYEIISAIRLHKQAGVTDSIIGGRRITRTKDLYSLEIRPKLNMINFQSNVSFTIKRKREKLNDALEILHLVGASQGLIEWKKKYAKRGRNWTKQE